METSVQGRLNNSLQVQRTIGTEKRYPCTCAIINVFERVKSKTQEKEVKGNVVTFCFFSLIYHCLFVPL